MQYKVEVLVPTGFTSGPAMGKQVQEKLDAYLAAGWRLMSMANVTGVGGVTGASIGPYLLLVFVAG